MIEKYKLFTVCTELTKSSYTEHTASGLPIPTHLEGEVRFAQAQDQQVITRSPRIVTECLLTHAMHSWNTYIYIYSRLHR